jgi:Holliday junction DNA helicase RuvB
MFDYCYSMFDVQSSTFKVQSVQRSKEMPLTPENPPTGTEFIEQTLAEPISSEESMLRPLSFSDFAGQAKTIERLKVMVGAARDRGEPLNHILLSGPPGLGKTTLSLILGHEMGKQVSITSGPVIDKPADLAGLLTNLSEGDILFIDEIHRIPKTVEEYLYSAMEDFRIDIMIDQGPNARSVRLSLPRFTLLGATTRMGLLTAPLRSRFTLQSRLGYYDHKTLQGIIDRTCGLLDVEFEVGGTAEIARRARGTPRIANNLVNFCRDYAQQRGDGVITQSMAAAALELLEIDQRGLDEMDKQIMRIMAENYRGGPVGLGTVAVAVGEEAHTLEEVHEPFLIQEGYLQRTAQGRVLTEKGWHVTGLEPKSSNAQPHLF